MLFQVPCLLWSFAVLFLFKLILSAFSVALPPLVVVCYSILIQFDAKGFSKCLASACGRLLFTFILMQNVLPGALPPPVAVSIQLLFKFDAKCIAACLASTCGRLLFN